MIRLIPTLAALLIACAVPFEAPRAETQSARTRDGVESPRSLERRARHASSEQRAELLRIAAQRWLARGERRRALNALSAAIEARPDDARLWLRRAEVHAAVGGTWKAIDDVTRAIDLDPTRAASYRTRATLWRRVGARDMAAADAAQAGALRQGSARHAGPPASTPRPSYRVDALDGHVVAANDGPRALTPGIAHVATRAIDPDALDALTLKAAQVAARPRSLLPASDQAAASGSAAGDEATRAAAPARSAILENPALDAVTVAASRLHASNAPASAHVASAAPMFPGPAPRSDLPAAPDPIEAHRRRMEAAAIVQRRIEAGEAMMAAMRAPAAGGLPDPSFRASTAPLPRIYRGTQIPPQLAARTGIARSGSREAGVGGPYLPVRKMAPAARQQRQAATPGAATTVVAALPQAQTAIPSFDATPADPMIVHGVAAPVIAVERAALR
jgi:tetratricopeptide (TPR) repeat protein